MVVFMSIETHTHLREREGKRMGAEEEKIEGQGLSQLCFEQVGSIM